MKGDFSRFTFDPTKHYRNVLTQQGRVAVDADSNEQQFITSHRIETETADTVGISGAPIDPDNNFELKIDKGQLIISKGHYYVDGILCINDTDCDYTNQPDCKMSLPDNGDFLIYIDVWEKHITYLDDDNIREKALGGPDTSTRLKTVWQVKHAKLTDQPNNMLNTLSRTPKAKLTAKIQPNSNSDSLCSQTLISSGYNRRENQLYRVEVHNKDTYKWSRDNGINVTKCTHLNTSTKNNDTLYSFKVDNIRNDRSVQFYQDQCVELIDDNIENNQLPGYLGTVVSVVNAQSTIITIKDLKDYKPPSDKDKNTKIKIRGWDGKGSIPTSSSSSTRTLEDGLSIEFTFETNQTCNTGDYWLIPIREGQLLNTVDKQEPHSIEHHYASLAIVNVGSNNKLNIISDLRNLFPSLTNLTSMFYVSGDGQQLMAGSTKLTHPLCVGVANGKYPVENAKVKFTIQGNGGGKLISNNESNITSVQINTDKHGIAQCYWELGSNPGELGSNPGSYHVKVELVGKYNEILTNVPLKFTARRESSYNSIRVKDVMVESGSSLISLSNDSTVDLDTIFKGIQVILDGTSSSNTKQYGFITIYSPLTLDGSSSASSIYAYQQLMSELTLDYISSNNTIRCGLNNNIKEWLNILSKQGDLKLRSIPVWMVLKGNYICLQPTRGDGKSGGDLEVRFKVEINNTVRSKVISIELLNVQGGILGTLTSQQNTLTLARSAAKIVKIRITFSDPIDKKSFEGAQFSNFKNEALILSDAPPPEYASGDTVVTFTITERTITQEIKGSIKNLNSIDRTGSKKPVDEFQYTIRVS